MDKIDAIIEIVSNKWETSDIIDAWNLMIKNKAVKCKISPMSSPDEVRCKIFPMSSFNEMFGSKSHLDVIQMVHNRPFGVKDDYFSFNTDGDIESFSDINDFSSFSYYDLADYLADKGDSLTKEVDSDELLAYFVEEYFDDDDNVRNILSDIIEKGEEPFDLLMDNWDDLFETAKNIIKNK